MGSEYLALARLGNNQWWRYVLSLVLILVLWFVVGSVLYLVSVTGGLFLVTAGDNPQLDLNELRFEDMETFEDIQEFIPPILVFLGTFLTFLPLLLGLFIAVRWIHGRPFWSLFTSRKRLNWGRVWQGFWIFGLLVALFTVLEAVVYPGRYYVTFDLGRFLPFLIVGIVLIPMQTTAEELLFRGYLTQGLGLLVKNPLVLATLSGLLFTLPHLANPELSAGFWLVAPQYFIVGFALVLTTLRDEGLELALGVHAANNLFVGLIATFPDSAIQSETIFASSVLDPVWSFISIIAAYGGFYLIEFGLRNKRANG